MTNLTESAMFDPAEDEGTGGRRILWMMVSGLGVVMAGGAIAGFLAEHQAEGGGAFSTNDIVILSIIGAIIAALSYIFWRNSIKASADSSRLLRREKLNQRIMMFSGLLGGAIAIVLMAASTSADGPAHVFSQSPIEPWVALVLAIIVGIGMPILSIYWHKHVIDEQESDAYRSGALMAVYAFWIAAPVWWLLWRGGMLPEPNGVALYLMTTFIALIVWFWKKYR